MKRSITIFLTLVVASLVLVRCTDDDDNSGTDNTQPKLLITFDPWAAEDEIHIGDRFQNPHGCTVEMSNLRFYLSNIRLHRSEGEPIDLSEIEFIDIKNHKRTLEFLIDPGAYTGLSFDLGVPEHLNGTDNPDFMVSVYSPSHALSEGNGMYWAWQTGYRFCVFEGRFDTVPNATYPLTRTFAFHSGLDTLFREVGFFPHAYNATAGHSRHMIFKIDLNKIFAGQADTVNLWYEREFHGSLSQIDLGIRYANNTAGAFQLIN